MEFAQAIIYSPVSDIDTRNIGRLNKKNEAIVEGLALDKGKVGFMLCDGALCIKGYIGGSCDNWHQAVLAEDLRHNHGIALVVIGRIYLHQVKLQADVLTGDG